MELEDAIRKEKRAVSFAETDLAEWEGIRDKYVKKKEAGVNDYNTIEVCDRNIEACKKRISEHTQYTEWLKELCGYRKAEERISQLTTVWEEGYGIQKCREIIETSLKEAQVDD